MRLGSDRRPFLVAGGWMLATGCAIEEVWRALAKSSLECHLRPSLLCDAFASAVNLQGALELWGHSNVNLGGHRAFPVWYVGRFVAVPTTTVNNGMSSIR